MTVYYVDPYSGSNAAAGTSWATAWKSFAAIREHSVLLAAGDTVRVAKSPVTASGLGTTDDNYQEVIGYWRMCPSTGLRVQEWPSGAVQTDGTGVVFYAAGSTVVYGGLVSLSDGDTAVFYNDGEDKAAIGSPLHTTGGLRGGGTLVPALTASGGTYVEAGAWPAFGDARAVYADATGGEYNTSSAKLFSIGTRTLNGTFLGNLARTATVERLSSEIRCSTVFSGTGADVDLPAGSLCIKIEVRAYVGQALLQEVYSNPLPAIRNSASVWTPFSVTFPTPVVLPVGSPPVILDAYLCRTSMSLDRDTSTFGLVVRRAHVHAAAVDAPCNRVYAGSRGATQTIPYSGLTKWNLRQGAAYSSCSASAMPVYFPAIPTAGEQILAALHTADNARLAASLERLSTVYLPELAWRNPTDKGLFDLGDTTGGTQGSPVVVSGGWDTATDTRTGITYFSGGLPPELQTDCAMFDVRNADHVRFEYIGVCGGFSSFLTRAKTVHLKGCGLPFAFRPGFGEVTLETHVTLEDMYVVPYALEGFGRIGNFSAVNVYAPCDPGSTAEGLREVADLYMNDSHIGMADGADLNHGFTQSAPGPFRIRGNAVVDNYLPLSTMCLVSVDFGHTLTYTNPRPAPLTSGYTSAVVQGVWPHPESRWDRVTYAYHPTYRRNWTNPENISFPFGYLYPSASCDEVIDETAMRVTFGGRWLESSLYQQSGNYAFDSEYRYVGGEGDVDMLNGLDGWIGAQTIVYQGRPPTESLTVGPRVGARYATQVSTPPLERQSDNGGATYTTTDPQAATTGLTLLAKRFSGISYRSAADVYLCVPYSPPYYPEWSIYVSNLVRRERVAVLKVIYVPRAGSYTAHFGCMKENVKPRVSTAAVPNPWIADRAYDGEGKLSIWETPGSLLGELVVRVGGRPTRLPYYASTSAEISGYYGSNKRLDTWVDFYVDFDMAAPGDVRLELWSDPVGTFNFIIFDILEVVARE